MVVVVVLIIMVVVVVVVVVVMMTVVVVVVVVRMTLVVAKLVVLIKAVVDPRQCTDDRAERCNRKLQELSVTAEHRQWLKMYAMAAGAARTFSWGGGLRLKGSGGGVSSVSTLNTGL